MSKALTKHNQCYSCIHRRTIFGDAHTRCAAPWESLNEMPKGHPHGISNGWWMFPFNFDPVWHMAMCPRYQAKEKS